MSKFDRNRIKDGWEKLCRNKQTDRQTDTTKIMVTWPWTNNAIWKRAASTWTRSLDWRLDFLTDIAGNYAAPCDSGKTHDTQCSASRNSLTSFVTKNRTPPSLCCTAAETRKSVQVHYDFYDTLHPSLNLHVNHKHQVTSKHRYTQTVMTTKNMYVSIFINLKFHKCRWLIKEMWDDYLPSHFKTDYLL